MFFTLDKRPYGVGLAAPQVGMDVAVSVIDIKPNKYQPERERVEMVLINPVILDTTGKRTGMWEGCISGGSTSGGLFAKAMRYKKLRLQWYDETGDYHEDDFEGVKAHVIQHEVDHLNGVLFVDKVKDTTTFMTSTEYRKRIVRPLLEERRRQRRKKKES